MITDPADLRGSLVAHRGDRFGGRFAAILTVMRAADWAGVPFHIVWSTPPDWPEVCHPEDLFSQDFMDRHFVDPALVPKLRWSAQALYPAKFGEEDFDRMIAEGKVFINEDTRARGFPWEDEAEVRAEIPAYWHRIDFSETLRGLVGQVDAVFSGADRTVAYHIRRGDLIDEDQYNSHRLHARGKYVPLAIYAEHIDQTLQAHPDAQIVVFSDEPRVLDRLRETSDRILGVRDIIGPMEMTIAQRDFIELYAMSRCPTIVGPPHSVFSASAAMLGNGQVVSVADDLEPARLERAHERIAVAMEGGARNFLSVGDMGQCMPYYLSHRDTAGRGDEATEVLRKQVAEGFDRSHAFPTLAQRYFAARRFDALDELRDATSRGLVLFEAATPVYLLSAFSRLLRGDDPAAVREMNAAYWLEPLDSLRDPRRTMEQGIALMIQTGRLGPGTIPPFDPALSWHRRPFFEDETGPWRDLDGLVEGETRTDHAIEAVGRDWMALGGRRNYPGGMIGRFKSPRFVDARVDKLLARFGDRDQPAVQAFLGLIARDLEAPEVARGHLDRALADAPETPLYLKRRADVHFDLDEGQAGLDMLVRARELAGDDIWYEATLAWRMLKHGDPKEARKMLVDLAGRDHPFPLIRQFVAQNLHRRPDQKERALAEVDRALEQVPGAPELVLLRGRVLADMDRKDEARAALETAARCHDQKRQALQALGKLGGA